MYTEAFQAPGGNGKTISIVDRPWIAIIEKIMKERIGLPSILRWDR